MIKQFLRRFKSWLLRDIATKDDISLLRSDIANSYLQLESLLAIYASIDPAFVPGRLRGWAISPDAIHEILVDLSARQAPQVLEFGCGESTILLAAFLQKCGGHLTTIEHDMHYLIALKNRFPNELLSTVTFCHAEIVKGQDGHIIYRQDLLPSSEYDLILVDGPPGNIEKNSRYGTLQWSIGRIRKHGSIYLDDYNRKDEQKSIQMILQRNTRLELTSLASEKGLARITVKKEPY